MIHKVILISFYFGVVFSIQCKHLNKLEDDRYGAFQYQNVRNCSEILKGTQDIEAEQDHQNKSYDYLMLHLSAQHPNAIVTNRYIKALFENYPETSIFVVQHAKFPELNNETFPIGSQSNLTYLLFRKNGLRHLKNSTFAGLSRLVILDLSENEISFIDENAFDKLEFLKFLYLNVNNIGKFEGKTFLHLKSLEILGAGRNKIEELQDGIFNNLEAIEHLDFKSNQIEEFQDGVLPKNLLNLTKINLWGNKIRHISKTLLPILARLTYLDLSNNDCVNQLFEYSDPPKDSKLLLETILFPLCCTNNFDFEHEKPVSRQQFWKILIGIPVLVISVVILGILVTKCIIRIWKPNSPESGVQYLGYAHWFEK